MATINIDSQVKRDLKTLWDLDEKYPEFYFGQAMLEGKINYDDEGKIILTDKAYLINQIATVELYLKNPELAVSKHHLFHQALYQAKEIICDDWKYCNRKQHLDDEGFSLAIAFIESAVTSGLPVMALIIYLVKEHMLDRICSC